MKKRISMLACTLAVVAMAGVASAATMFAVGTTEQFQVSDAGVVTNGLNVVGNIGIGTTTPAGAIHSIANGTTNGGAYFQFTANGASQPGVTPVTGSFWAPNFSLYRNNDANVNSGLPRIDDALGYFNFGTLFGATRTNRALIYAFAEKNWTSTTDSPAYFQFLLNPGGVAQNREVLRISSQGIMKVNGGVRLYPYTGTVPNPALVPAKPTCDANAQGTIWFTKATGADTLQVCADGSTGLAWRTITLP